MKKIIFIHIFVINCFIFAECIELEENSCNSNNDCFWFNCFCFNNNVCEEFIGDMVPNIQYTDAGSGGDSAAECYPEEFVNFQSSSQGFYIFDNVTINGVQISSEDWVGAFNGSTCVGARQWGFCGSANACDVPMNGYDGGDLCDGYITFDGYMSIGDIPTFKIYDASENMYYNATPTTSPSWSPNMAEQVEYLLADSDIYGCTDELACNYNPYANIYDASCEYTSCPPYSWDEDGDGVLDNYNAYEFNGSLTALITSDGINSYASNNDMLAAFVNGEQRGVALADLIPFGPYEGTYQFQMMIYSNEIQGETLTFQYYNQSSNLIYNISETLSWQSDMTEGDVVNPVILSLGPVLSGNDTPVPSMFSIRDVYPNPFNPNISIQFELLEASNIIFKFYDIIGKQVDVIDYGYTSHGIYTIGWSPKLPSGTYFILMSNGTNTQKKKVTLIK